MGGMNSNESVLSTLTQAKGTSMQGDIRRGVLDRSSTISDAVGLLVAHMCQQDLSRVSLKDEYKSIPF